MPALEAGEYTLQIVTKFSNGSTFLKETGVIEYSKLLVIA
ncbi:MAG: DUF4469 domain-containing protein [Bacteroidales bacterium]|nr:DUF4469 domain-containing protein [Bacteroidales bacterium]